MYNFIFILFIKCIIVKISKARASSRHRKLISTCWLGKCKLVLVKENNIQFFDLIEFYLEIFDT